VNAAGRGRGCWSVRSALQSLNDLAAVIGESLETTAVVAGPFFLVESQQAAVFQILQQTGDGSVDALGALRSRANRHCGCSQTSPAPR